MELSLIPSQQCTFSGRRLRHGRSFDDTIYICGSLAGNPEVGSDGAWLAIFGLGPPVSASAVFADVSTKCHSTRQTLSLAVQCVFLLNRFSLYYYSSFNPRSQADVRSGARFDVGAFGVKRHGNVFDPPSLLSHQLLMDESLAGWGRIRGGGGEAFLVFSSRLTLEITTSLY